MSTTRFEVGRGDLSISYLQFEDDMIFFAQVEI